MVRPARLVGIEHDEAGQRRTSCEPEIVEWVGRMGEAGISHHAMNIAAGVLPAGEGVEGPKILGVIGAGPAAGSAESCKWNAWSSLAKVPSARQ